MILGQNPPQKKKLKMYGHVWPWNCPDNINQQPQLASNQPTRTSTRTKTKTENKTIHPSIHHLPIWNPAPSPRRTTFGVSVPIFRRGRLELAALRAEIAEIEEPGLGLFLGAGWWPRDERWLMAYLQGG